MSTLYLTTLFFCWHWIMHEFKPGKYWNTGMMKTLEKISMHLRCHSSPVSGQTNRFFPTSINRRTVESCVSKVVFIKPLLPFDFDHQNHLMWATFVQQRLSNKWMWNKKYKCVVIFRNIVKDTSPTAAIILQKRVDIF